MLTLVSPKVTAGDDLYFYEPFAYQLEEGSSFQKVAVSRPGLIGPWVFPGFAPKSQVEFQRDSLNFSPGFPTQGGALRLRTDLSNSASAVQSSMEFPLEGEVWHSYLFKLAVMPRDFSSYIQSKISNHACTAAKAGNTGMKPTNQARPGVGYANRPALSMATSESGAALPADVPLEADAVYFAVSRFERIGQEISEQNPGKASIWVFDAQGFEELKKSASAKPLSDEILDGHATWKATNTVTSMNWDKVNESGFDRFMLESFRGEDSFFDELRLGKSCRSVIPLSAPPR